MVTNFSPPPSEIDVCPFELLSSVAVTLRCGNGGISAMTCLVDVKPTFPDWKIA